MDAASPAAIKKQKERTTKKAKQEAIVNSVKMLLLVPKRTTFVFSLTCSDDESNDFYSWLNEGHNNTDFLVEKGLVKSAKQKSAYGVITFSEVEGKQVAKCNQANILMAFLTARQLGMKDNEGLRFTYFENFLSCLHDKMKCDEVFETLKLPFIYTNVTSCATESAEIAFNELKKKYPDNEHVLNIPKCGLVAKTVDNHSALGVYFFEQSNDTHSCWKLTRDNPHSFVPPQTPMRFEPFVSELKQSETRIYAILIPGQKVSLHYKVKTGFGPKGLTLEQLAVACESTSRNFAERKLIKDAYDLFCTKFPSSIDAVMHLTLRFDVFHCSGKLYLNEVDVIPGAYLFLDDYFGTRVFLMKLSNTMATYIRNNWALWPA